MTKEVLQRAWKRVRVENNPLHQEHVLLPSFVGVVALALDVKLERLWVFEKLAYEATTTRVWTVDTRTGAQAFHTTLKASVIYSIVDRRTGDPLFCSSAGMGRLVLHRVTPESFRSLLPWNASPTGILSLVIDYLPLVEEESGVTIKFKGASSLAQKKDGTILVLDCDGKNHVRAISPEGDISTLMVAKEGELHELSYAHRILVCEVTDQLYMCGDPPRSIKQDVKINWISSRPMEAELLYLAREILVTNHGTLQCEKRNPKDRTSNYLWEIPLHMGSGGGRMYVAMDIRNQWLYYVSRYAGTIRRIQLPLHVDRKYRAIPPTSQEEPVYRGTSYRSELTVEEARKEGHLYYAELGREGVDEHLRAPFEPSYSIFRPHTLW